MAGASITHLNLMTHATHQEEALQLARSTVSLAIERIIATPDRGQSRVASDAISLQLQGDDPNALGQVSFEKSNALGIPYSTNNLANAAAVPGDLNHIVPANSVHIISVGRSGGITQQVQAVLTLPPFPYSVASDGNMDGSGGLQIAGVRSVPTGPVPASELLPADLLSNANIQLGPGSLVKGDVQSGGTVQFVGGASNVVSGTVRTGAAPRQIPEMNLSTYDPRANNYAFSELAEVGSGDTVYQGMARREGDLSVAGDLKLDGGLVYVNGDLTVTGGLQGKGLVVATGKIDVKNCSSLVGGSNMAILGGGEVHLNGTGSDGSYIQGLVYSKGNFSATKVTVVGSMVTKGTGTFHDARLLSPPGSGSTTVPVQSGGTAGGSNFVMLYFENPAGAATTPASDPTTMAWTSGIVIQKVHVGGTDKWQVSAYPNATGGAGGSIGGSPGTPAIGYADVDPGHPNLPIVETLLPVVMQMMKQSGHPTGDENVIRTWLGQAIGHQPMSGVNDPPITPTIPSVPGLGSGPGTYTIDPSSVLSLGERIRVTLWKEN